MKEVLHIGEVAKLFGVSRATLRFWESEGLLPQRREDNSYRQFTLQELTILSDIMYYRDLRLPIREIRALPGKDLDGLDRLLATSDGMLEQEIGRLRQAQEKTRRRRGNIARARELEQDPYRPAARMPVARVVEFDFTHQERLRRYLTRPELYVLVRPREGDLLFGMEVEVGEFLGATPSWDADQGAGSWVTFLFRPKEGREEQELDLHRERLAQEGWRMGDMVGRYLLSTAIAGESRDYFEAWAQVERC